MTGKLAGIGTGMSNIMMNQRMMHPRALKIEARKVKKVLKSTVRLRPHVPTPVELIEVDKQFENVSSTGVELPFENEDDMYNENNTDMNIFASSHCELPYKECDNNEDTEKKSCVRRVYRPSSPDCD